MWQFEWKGVINLPAQKVSSVGRRHPPRRSLAMLFTWQKAMSSALTRTDVAIQTELPQKHAAPSSHTAGSARAFHW